MGLYSDYIWFKVIIYLGIQLFTMASSGDTMDNQKKVCSLGNCQLSHNFNGLCVEFCDLLMHQHATFILNIFNFHMKGDVTGWIRWFYFWRFFILPRCFHKKMTGTVTYSNLGRKAWPLTLGRKIVTYGLFYLINDIWLFHFSKCFSVFLVGCSKKKLPKWLNPWT